MYDLQMLLGTKTLFTHEPFCCVTYLEMHLHGKKYFRSSQLNKNPGKCVAQCQIDDLTWLSKLSVKIIMCQLIS